MKLLALALTAVSVVLMIVFFKLSAAINKMRSNANLGDAERAAIYKKITALVLVGIGIAVCSATSVLLLLPQG